MELEDELDRYHRQNLIHWWDQSRLSKASVLVVGAGALGNEIVKNLALIGVGQIKVVDLDLIESSNLSRCLFFRAEDEGKPKAEVVAAAASALNPEVSVSAVVGDVRLCCGLGSFADVDVVIGGLDNREARIYVNQACWKTSTPWIDGAIEGLMGVVRVFIPPDTACYECTMGEKDYEHMAKRRACSLLKKEEMVDGKVPTTATSSSVVAGLQVQEAVKIIHEDRLGRTALAGRGFQFVGLTHDSYLVEYRRDENCLSHETYELEDVPTVDPEAPFREAVELSGFKDRKNLQIELEHEFIVKGDCDHCGKVEEIMVAVEAAPSGIGLCSECGESRQLAITHLLEVSSEVLVSSPLDLGLPKDDVIAVRSGSNRVLMRLHGGSD